MENEVSGYLHCFLLEKFGRRTDLLLSLIWFWKTWVEYKMLISIARWSWLLFALWLCRLNHDQIAKQSSSKVWCQGSKGEFLLRIKSSPTPKPRTRFLVLCSPLPLPTFLIRQSPSPEISNQQAKDQMRPRHLIPQFRCGDVGLLSGAVMADRAKWSSYQLVVRRRFNTTCGVYKPTKRSELKNHLCTHLSTH